MTEIPAEIHVRSHNVPGDRKKWRPIIQWYEGSRKNPTIKKLEFSGYVSKRIYDRIRKQATSSKGLMTYPVITGVNLFVIVK